MSDSQSGGSGFKFSSKDHQLDLLKKATPWPVFLDNQLFFTCQMSFFTLFGLSVSNYML